MSPELLIVVFWLLFTVTHTVPSSAALRPGLIERLGNGTFLGLYSLVSFATFGPLVWIYFTNRHGGELLYSPGPSAYLPAQALAFGAFVLLTASAISPSPVSMMGHTEATGLSRITRHPAFLSTGLIGLAHLLLFGYATDVAFFGGLFLYSMFGSWHQDQRQKKTRPELASMFESTSWFPFAAIVAGRNRLVASELPWLGFVAGAGAAWAVWLLHAWLLGL